MCLLVRFELCLHVCTRSRSPSLCSACGGQFFGVLHVPPSHGSSATAGGTTTRYHLSRRRLRHYNAFPLNNTPTNTDHHYPTLPNDIIEQAGALFAGLLMVDSPFAKKAHACMQPLTSLFGGMYLGSLGMIVNPVRERSKREQHGRKQEIEQRKAFFLCVFAVVRITLSSL